MRLFSRRGAASAARIVRAVVESMERRLLLDGTTWVGFNGTPNDFEYGVTNVPDGQYVMGDAPKTSWTLEQQALPDHTHIGASFSLNIFQADGTFGTTGTLTLQGPCGSITVDPLDSSVPPTLTPGAGFGNSDVQGGYENGTIWLNGPDGNQQFATWTLTSSGNDMAGFGVTAGSATAGTGVGFKAVDGVADSLDAWRGGDNGDFILTTDYPVQPRMGNFSLYFQTGATPEPTIGQGIGPWQPKDACYAMSGNNISYWGSKNGYLIYQVPMAAGQQTATINVQAITPYMQAESSNMAIGMDAISNPNLGVQGKGGNPALQNVIPEDTNFSTTIVPNAAVFLHGLIISPHVPGELTDSQMDTYVTAFQNVDPEVREANYQSMLASLKVCPSQYDHDYLLGIEDQSNDPSVNQYIDRAMLAVYTSDPSYEFLYSNQVLTYKGAPLPQGWRDAFFLEPGNNLSGTVIPWTWSIPQNQMDWYQAGDTEKAFVTSTGTTQNANFGLQSNFQTSVDGVWTNQATDYYHAAFSVTQS